MRIPFTPGGFFFFWLRTTPMGESKTTPGTLPALTNLYTVRVQRRWSQRQLARAAGFSHNYVYLLEHGLPVRDAADVAKLAAPLGVRPETLTGAPLLVLESVGADSPR
jgi:hypothetical protein